MYNHTYCLTVRIGNLTPDQLDELDKVITQLEKESAYCDVYELEND